MGKFAGLDIHSKQCTFVVMDAAGVELASGCFATTPEGIEGWAKEFAGEGTELRVGMESCAMAKFVSQQLQLSGVSDLLVVDAGEVRAKARRKRQKSDYTDAYELCDGIRRDQYVKLVHMPDKFTNELRLLLSQRRHFVRLQTAEKNAMKSLLRREGLAQIYKQLVTEVAFEKLLAHPAIRPALKERLSMHFAVWLELQKQVEKLKDALEQHSASKQGALSILTTMPGVGPITSMTMIAYLNDWQRFGSAKQAASYSGLVPRTYHSAESERFGRITKTGSAELRAMLCEAAQHARRKSHPLNAMFRKITARKGYKVAVVAVAHKLCRMLWAMLRDGASFDPMKIAKSKWDALLPQPSVA
jgi:transposase